ncbi:hypothetical protein KST23_05540 [Fusobacterium nucleatum]|uniref:hypothetical protein n=1 Tax=Fusobacterium nucleatum TaxID=851 RepID=UPI003CFEABAE
MKGYGKARGYNNYVTYDRVAKKFSKGDFIPMKNVSENNPEIIEKNFENLKIDKRDILNL